MAPPTRLQFLLEEYKSLRAEIELHFNATLTIQPLVFAGLGGIFVLLQYNRLAVWGIPVVILVAGLASIPHYVRMIALGKYLYSIESEVFGDNGGWEHYLRKGQPKDGTARLPRVFSLPFFVFTTLAWIILGTCAVILAFYGGQS
jgi:hypothetical protein